MADSSVNVNPPLYDNAARFYFGREVVFMLGSLVRCYFVLLSLIVFFVSFSRRRHLSW